MISSSLNDVRDKSRDSVTERREYLWNVELDRTSPSSVRSKTTKRPELTRHLVLSLQSNKIIEIRKVLHIESNQKNEKYHDEWKLWGNKSLRSSDDGITDTVVTLTTGGIWLSCRPYNSRELRLRILRRLIRNLSITFTNLVMILSVIIIVTTTVSQKRIDRDSLIHEISFDMWGRIQLTRYNDSSTWQKKKVVLRKRTMIKIVNHIQYTLKISCRKIWRWRTEKYVCRQADESNSK